MIRRMPDRSSQAPDGAPTEHSFPVFVGLSKARTASQILLVCFAIHVTTTRVSAQRAIVEADVRRAITVAYAEMQAADLNGDRRAWLAHLAPGFVGVGQTGHVFTFSTDPATTEDSEAMTTVSEQFQIQTLSWSGDAALVIVRHRQVLHLVGHELNGRNLGPKPEHIIRADEIMRQVWLKIGSDWKLKHWDDMSGTIWVDGQVQERWTPDRLMAPPR